MHWFSSETKYRKWVTKCSNKGRIRCRNVVKILQISGKILCISEFIKYISGLTDDESLDFSLWISPSSVKITLDIPIITSDHLASCLFIKSLWIYPSSACVTSTSCLGFPNTWVVVASCKTSVCGNFLCLIFVSYWDQNDLMKSMV